jgi:hypothetical protein
MKHETSEWKERFHSDISVAMQSCEGTDFGCFFVGCDGSNSAATYGAEYLAP